MTEAHPCLLSIGKTSSKYWHFPFLQDQVKIGRSVDVTYTILSATISRCHAIINRQEDKTWTITDNKSLNGISVNGKKLEALEPCPLHEGDIVQLGVPASPDVRAEFVYRFFSCLKVRKQKGSKKRPSSEDGSQCNSKRQKATESEGSKLPAESPAGDEKNSQEDKETQRAEDGLVGAGVGKKKEEDQESRLKSLYEEQLRSLAQQLKEKEEEKLAIAQQLEQEREERQVVEEKRKEQEELVHELDNRQRQLAQEKVAAEEEMQRQMEEKLREREELLRGQMQQHLEQLALEKSQVEERLQKEMEKAVQEKDKELQERLQGEKDCLQKIIENKELEQKALESQLAESRVENEKARSDTVLTRESILSEFAETMETELQCAICNELFIKATSLNCSHAFCSLCLRQWLAVKKECPNCRAPVTSQMHSIVLDNYIDRMVEQLSADMKERRTQTVAERKEAEKKLDEAENKVKAGPSGAAGAGRGRNQSRGSGSRRRGRGRGSGGGGGSRGGRSAAAAAAAEEEAARVAAATALVEQLRAASAVTFRHSGAGAPVAAPVQAAVPPTGAVTAAGAVTATAGGAAATEAATMTGVPAVGAVITIGSDMDVVEDANLDATVAEAILVSESESESDSEDDNSDQIFSVGPWRRHPSLDIVDDEEEVYSRGATSDTDEDDGFYIEGTGAYYGGYGRCFKCGARGHWANGCPYD